MKYSLYLKENAERNLETIFEYLKRAGDIPKNAVSIGDYRAQCITFAIHYTVADLQLTGEIDVMEIENGKQT